MALSANSVFEIQTGGDDTNGGGFVTGAAGTDYSLVAGKRVATGTDDSTTDAVGNGTTTLTSATANFQASIVGNIIYLQGGTGALAATRRQVTARASSTSITVDASVAAGTGITMNVGGALASIGGAGAIALVTDNTIWIKAGTYTIASATSNVPTGCLSKAVVLRIEGYQTTRGDLGTPPLLQASGISNFTVISITLLAHLANINIDGAGLTTSRGITIRGWAYKCDVINCLTHAYSQSTIAHFINCIASGGGPGFISGHYYGCVSHTNAGRGFILGPERVASRCISYGNTGANGIGFDNTSGEAVAINCVAYGNAADGFRTGANQVNFINCIAENNTSDGFQTTAGDAVGLYNCAVFGNGTNFNLGADNLTVNLNSITGASSFFTNAAGGDFSLNNTGGAGAALKAAGFPGIFPGGLTTGYLDIGAAQHQDSGGGGEHSAVF